MYKTESDTTLRWLSKERVCIDGYLWIKKQKNRNTITILKKLILYNIEWFNWLLARKLTKINKIKYAIFCAELSLHKFKKEYPEDNSLRLAIKPTNETYMSVNTYTEAYKATIHLNSISAIEASRAIIATCLTQLDNPDTEYIIDYVTHAVRHSISSYRTKYSMNKAISKISYFGISLLKAQ